jgi:serine/threonine-protein phosphatase 2A regulatory subunit A
MAQPAVTAAAAQAHAGAAAAAAAAAAPSADDEVDVELYPIAVLLDELKNDDIKLRLNATRRLKTIAAALGPERTRSELLPFLTDTTDDDDEVLLALADELGHFVDEIGGPSHASCLMDPLESLTIVEETTVRDKAVQSLRLVSETVLAASPVDADTLHVHHLFPLVRRLATAGYYTSRISACSLFGTAYTRVPADRGDLRAEIIAMYKSLAREETPMVRRAAASNIGHVARAVASLEPALVASELLPVFANLVDDEQDSVRLLVVENAATFASLLSAAGKSDGEDAPDGDAMAMTPTAEDGDAAEKELAEKSTGADDKEESTVSDTTMETAGESTAGRPSVTDGTEAVDGKGKDIKPMEQIISMVRSFGADRSWRVRYLAADQLSDLCLALGPTATREVLLPAFLQLLRDIEPEVRTAAAFKSTDIARRIVALPPTPESPDADFGLKLVVRDVLPIIRELVNDNSQHVRAALASNIMGLAPVLGVDVTVKHLVEVVLSLLKDEFPEVRLNVISRLDKVSFFLSADVLSRELLPAIVELAEDKNWRIRLAIVGHIPLLARELGRDFFNDNKQLGELCLSWLRDSVYTIREAASVNLKALTEVFGVVWAKEHIVPPVLALFEESSNYLFRMTALYAIGILAQVVGPEMVEGSFLTTLVEGGSKDPVPNVRFCSAKTINRVIPYVRAEARESKIRPCLVSLIDGPEKDEDVKYFAQEALDKLAACPA